MRLFALVPLLVILLVGGCIYSACSELALWHQTNVTWYNYPESRITASGQHFSPWRCTCAVRDRTKLGHWFLLMNHRYSKRVGSGTMVLVYANDLLPTDSRAEFDLTPAAFLRLAPLSDGRLTDVYWRDGDNI